MGQIYQREHLISLKEKDWDFKSLKHRCWRKSWAILLPPFTSVLLLLSQYLKMSMCRHRPSLFSPWPHSSPFFLRPPPAPTSSSKPPSYSSSWRPPSSHSPVVNHHLMHILLHLVFLHSSASPWPVDHLHHLGPIMYLLLHILMSMSINALVALILQNWP